MSERDEHPADTATSELFGLAVPGLGVLAGRASKAVRAEWARNTSTALRAAERASGLKREDLEEYIETEPELIPLYLYVLWAAGMNGHDETLRAMGAALGDAAHAKRTASQSGFEAAEDVLRAMRGFTPRHFQALRAIAAHRESSASVMPEGVALETGMSTDRAAGVLTSLAAAGLALTHQPWGKHLAYPITELGLAVLRAADETRE